MVWTSHRCNRCADFHLKRVKGQGHRTSKTSKNDAYLEYMFTSGWRIAHWPRPAHACGFAHCTLIAVQCDARTTAYMLPQGVPTSLLVNRRLCVILLVSARSPASLTKVVFVGIGPSVNRASNGQTRCVPCDFFSFLFRVYSTILSTSEQTRNRKFKFLRKFIQSVNGIINVHCSLTMRTDSWYISYNQEI